MPPAALSAELPVHVALAEKEDDGAEQGPQGDLPHFENLGRGQQVRGNGCDQRSRAEAGQIADGVPGPLTRNTTRALSTSDSCASAPRPKAVSMSTPGFANRSALQRNQNLVEHLLRVAEDGQARSCFFATKSFKATVKGMAIMAPGRPRRNDLATNDRASSRKESSSDLP
jgi:hypothetical protein